MATQIPTQNKKAKILFVDDDDNLRFAMRKALSRYHLEVVGCDDGRIAIDVLKTGRWQGERIELCVLDLRMPKMHGFEILNAVDLFTVPVIVLTGHGSVEDAVRALRAGASDFVQKPIGVKDLVERVMPLLGEPTRRAQAGDRLALAKLERQHIETLLREVRNVSEVARILEIDRRTLQRKMSAWRVQESAQNNSATSLS